MDWPMCFKKEIEIASQGDDSYSNMLLVAVFGLLNMKYTLYSGALKQAIKKYEIGVPICQILKDLTLNDFIASFWKHYGSWSPLKIQDEIDKYPPNVKQLAQTMQMKIMNPTTLDKREISKCGAFIAVISAIVTSIAIYGCVKLDSQLNQALAECETQHNPVYCHDHTNTAKYWGPMIALAFVILSSLATMIFGIAMMCATPTIEPVEQVQDTNQAADAPVVPITRQAYDMRSIDDAASVVGADIENEQP
eukprot:NODE_540_length_6251_cov_1.082250.p3 type:complete len:250 gc:universal NODE_540_length_6251_cov_1.082250:1396-647(-)